MVSLPGIARALRGKVVGNQVLAPGPNHSAKDRSLSVQLSPGSPDGFIVFSHAGDDFRTCRDYVAGALGMPSDRMRHHREVDPAEIQRLCDARRQAEERHRAETLRRQAQARAIWQDCRDPRGTIVEAYLRSRCLDLSEEVSGNVLRYHPHCPWESGTAPAMVAALRCVRTSEITGIHRTALTPDGRKVSRRMLGVAVGAAVMLDAEDVVASGLTIGEGIETCLAARQLGIRPTWALGSVGAIAAFPVLDGIETLTVLAENDISGASARACKAVGSRWRSAGRSADSVKPKIGTDMNDVLMGGAPGCH